MMNKLHYVTLSNGRIIGIEECDQEVCVALMDGKQVDMYICSINKSGVLVYPNSGDATEDLTAGLLSAKEPDDIVQDLIKDVAGRLTPITLRYLIEELSTQYSVPHDSNYLAAFVVAMRKQLACLDDQPAPTSVTPNPNPVEESAEEAWYKGLASPKTPTTLEYKWRVAIWPVLGGKAEKVEETDYCLRACTVFLNTSTPAGHYVSMFRRCESGDDVGIWDEIMKKGG